MQRLADSLALVAPSLAPELVGGERIEHLTAVAGSLPPIHRAGFECRLAAGENRVDLQQCLLRSDREPERLMAFLGSVASTEAWEPVRRLGRRWSSPGDPVHERVSELWLELDLLAGADDPPPSVFVALRTTDGDRGHSGADASLDALVGADAAATLCEVVRRLDRHCPAPAQISHIGVLLGRHEPSLRVNVKPVPLSSMDQYLRRVGFADGRQAAIRLARTLLDHCDLLTLGVDIVDDQIVAVGLECFFERDSGLDPRWGALLDDTVELGLCAPEKAKALLRWPGVVTPADADHRWPENLIVRGLRRPAQELSVLERRLSHIKVTCAAGAPVTAKAYFGYGELWISGRAQTPERSLPSRPAPAPTPLAAIERAVGGLLAMRNQAGWWRDFFRTPSVSFSDEWVTAFIADALANAPDARGPGAAAQALELLLRRRKGAPGWGYHVLLPPDGDATTWVLRLARSLSAPAHPRLVAGRRLIAELTRGDGAVYSYTESYGEDLARFLEIEDSGGWCGPHTCVSAAAALLAVSGATPSYLRASQQPDGGWSGYWWEDDEYATAWAVQALAAEDPRDVAVRSAVAWCTSRIAADGSVHSRAHGGPSPFATALALYAIRAAGGARGTDRANRAAERAEQWLLSQQLGDGTWEASARMQVPFPEIRVPSESPDEIERYVRDRGAFTTATVLAALSRSAA